MSDFLSKLDEYVWEEVELPSKGLFYGNSEWSKVPIPGGIIKVRPWTINEEKILNTTRLVKSGQAFDMIFKHACKLPEGFDPQELLIGDRAFLMLYFRGISYGNNYEFSVPCTNEACGKVSPYEYNLNDLAGSITYSKDDSVEPFAVDLPDATKKVGKQVKAKLRLTRQHDLRNIEIIKNAKLGAKDSKDAIDESVLVELAQNVVEIYDGATAHFDKNIVSKIISKLSARDCSIMRNCIRDNTPGVAPVINVDCPLCGNHMEMDLPIKETFFRYTG